MGKNIYFRNIFLELFNQRPFIMKATPRLFIFCLVTLQLFYVLRLPAQQALLSACNNAQGSNGSVTYSIGQIAYLVNSGNNGNSMEGVQQPYEIQYYSGIEEGHGISLDYKVFPNPCPGSLFLSVGDKKDQYLHYDLLNADGSSLRKGEIVSSQTSIDLNDLTPAVYFLTVSQHDKVLITFRVIKK